MKAILGIDVGATSIKCGLFTNRGVLLEKWSLASDLENSGRNIPFDIVNSVNVMLNREEYFSVDVVSMGIGVPGPVDSLTGTVIKAVNIGWDNFPLKKELENNLSYPVFIGNDANLAALGEFRAGAGKLYDHMAMFTIGSGVGGAVIKSGNILEGYNFSAGEFGHIKINNNRNLTCNCGATGCLETTASANGLIKAALKEAEANETHFFNVLLREKGKITAEDVVNLAKDNDSIAMKLLNNLSNDLAIGIANVCCVLNPEVIVVGGGMAAAGEFLINKISACYRTHCFPSMEDTKLILAELGNDAGIYGAMSLAKANIIQNSHGD